MARRRKGNSKNKLDKMLLLNFAKDSYFERTSRPFYAAIFLLPFIIFYEIGTIAINTDVLMSSQVRVVAFVWLQNFLEYLGFASKFAWVAPPIAVLVILFSLQIASRKSWKLWPQDLWQMAAESIILAIPLIVLSLFLITTTVPKKEQGQTAAAAVTKIQFVNSAAAPAGAGTVGEAKGAESTNMLADIVTGIGAGIYEELVFRLILISVLVILLADVGGMSQNRAIVISVVISAALFSAHHHIDFFTGQQTDALDRKSVV
jgi:membrane protease YdiL (CAAX protease family)